MLKKIALLALFALPVLSHAQSHAQGAGTANQVRAHASAVHSAAASAAGVQTKTPGKMKRQLLSKCKVQVDGTPNLSPAARKQALRTCLQNS